VSPDTDRRYVSGCLNRSLAASAACLIVSLPERALFPHEREDVRQQRLRGRSIRQLGLFGYGIGVRRGKCRAKAAER
jgi:hypothetical protein